MATKFGYKISEYSWQKVETSEENEDPIKPNRVRTILSRAALVYLGSFVGLSLFLSVLGINPLIHNGALPKCLLIFVGLATLLAMANSESNLIAEQVRSHLAIYSHRLQHDYSQRAREQR